MNTSNKFVATVNTNSNNTNEVTLMNIQAQFNIILANQYWYGLSLNQKIAMLCTGGKEYTSTLNTAIVAVESHRRTHKQRSATTIAKKRNKRVVKVARATTVIFDHGIKTSNSVIAKGRELLRSIGRKVSNLLPSQVELEVFSLNISELTWKIKEEAVNTAWIAFKAELSA